MPSSKSHRFLPVIGAMLTFVAFVTHDYLAESAKDFATELHQAQSERATRQELGDIISDLKAMHLKCNHEGDCDALATPSGGVGFSGPTLSYTKTETYEDCSRRVQSLIDGQQDVEEITRALKEENLSRTLDELKSSSASVKAELTTAYIDTSLRKRELFPKYADVDVSAEEKFINALEQKQASFLRVLLPEAEQQLELKRSRAQISTTISICCYVLGAVFVIVGKVLEPAEEVELGG